METTHHKALHNDEPGENARRPKRPVVKVELSEREKKRLRDYFEDRAARLEVIATTRTPCLPASSNTYGRHCLP